MDDLHEASTNLDREQMTPLLVRIQGRVRGLPDSAVALIAREVSTMRPDDEREWVFSVEHRDARVPLHVRVFMDDIDAPDLYILTSEGLAREIQDDMLSLADGL